MSTARKPAAAPQKPDLRERATSLKESLARASGREGAARTAHPRDFADQFDFSALSVAEIARLSEAARMISDMWMHFSNAPYCYTDADRTARPVWAAYDFECSRIGFLRDRCIHELEGRIPQDGWERDEILCARLKHELECNDSIAEPGLLVEAVKAWG